MKCFLSYRRADAEDQVREVFLYLQGRFGRGSVFWDRESILPDSEWETVLRRANAFLKACVSLYSAKARILTFPAIATSNTRRS